MKKFYVHLIVLFMVSGARAQWFPQNSGTTNGLNSVYFTDANTGYAVGYFGTILKTVDGGINWALMPSGTLTNLNSVYFTDEFTGHIAGEGEILKTLNGGMTWNVDMSDTNYIYEDIEFPTSSTGFITGHRGFPFPTLNVSIVRKSSDGGNNWDSVFSVGGNAQVLSLDFPSEYTGYIAGWWGGLPNAGFLFRTNDAGNIWEECAGGSAYTNFYALMFINDSIGYWVSGDMPLKSSNDKGFNWLCKTINGGESHSKNGFGFGDQIKDIYFFEDGLGYAVGYNEQNDYGIILKTIDDGLLTWSLQCSVPSYGFTSIYFPSEDTGYAVGWNGIIYRTTNGGGGSTVIDETKNLMEPLIIYPNPSSTNITISTPTTPQKNTYLTISDLNGQALLSRQIRERQTVVDVSGLVSGVYFVKVSNDRTVMVGKVVKQ